MASAERSEPPGLGYALKQAQNALRRRMDEDLRALGLTVPQYAVLATLEANPDISNADLARAAFVTPQSMQGILANLERSGLVTRRSDAHHGRRRLAALTGEGARRVRDAHGVAHRMEDLLARAAAPLDPEAVRDMLVRCREALSTV